MSEPQEISDFPATVTFMPGMRTGAPTIGGTRLSLITVLHALWDGGVEYAADGWGVTRDQCLVAAWFAGVYGIADHPRLSTRPRGAVWQKRYGEWAKANEGNLWSGHFGEVPDPPSQLDEAGA